MTWSEVTNPVNDSQDPRCPDSEFRASSVLRVASGMSGISLGDLPFMSVNSLSFLLLLLLPKFCLVLSPETPGPNFCLSLRGSGMQVSLRRDQEGHSAAVRLVGFIHAV